MAMSGSSRGSMALAASALQLFEEARTAADRPSTGAGVGGMVDPTSFGAAAHDNTASGSHRRKRSKGSKRRFQQAAAAAEEAVLRKASFGKAKKEIDGIRDAHHRKSDVYEANIRALRMNTSEGNLKVAEKAVAMHHRIPAKRKKKKAPEENWSVFAETDRLAAEKKKRKMEKYAD
eukprot:m.121731 g.121731  ORF g.121731 m.121731 type:complete len:176 (-) comp21915_c0_seq1:298-825(-)